jgi:hypothetical protein
MTTYHDPFTLEEAMREIRALRAEVERKRDYGRAEYQRGRDECMAEWADHMKRINGALEGQQT